MKSNSVKRNFQIDNALSVTPFEVLRILFNAFRKIVSEDAIRLLTKSSHLTTSEEMFYVSLALLIVILLFIIYRITRKVKVNVEYNPNGNIKHLVEKMTTFKKPYKPTSWLISSHFHTAYGMRYRPRSLIMGSERREMFLFSDGGTSALDYFEPKDATNSPFVVLAHTLGGGTREPVINNLAEACNKKGWRVVVANGRGSSGAPITSARLPSCLDWDDLNEIINHIRELYHPPYIFLAGFSLGALQSMEYSTKDAALDIDGIAAVSHTYDLLKGALVLEKPIQMRLYTPIICHQLHHALEKSKQFFDEPAAMNSRTMREFDDVFTSKKKGFPNGIEYYKAGNIYSKIDNAKVPTLVLGADDDPFTVKDAMPIKEARASKNVAFAHTAEGGHVSFITGNDGLHSLIDEMIPEWFQVIMDEKKKND